MSQEYDELGGRPDITILTDNERVRLRTAHCSMQHNLLQQLATRTNMPLTFKLLEHVELEVELG